MTNNQESIISHVLMQIATTTVVSEEDLRKIINIFKILNPISAEEEEEVVKELHSRLSIRMDRGACVKDKNHVTWYYTAKRDIQPLFWDRYRTYLMRNQGFNGDVIDSLDASTDEMMDLLGNPAASTDFSRCGLVIGDVQSGKTSTYTALINKAADAGYKIVILLTGTIEKLRRQTQGRLDAGFVGLDSTAFTRNKDNVYIGVGNIDPSVTGWAVTSTSSDFNTNAAKQLNGRLSGIASPVLFVLKKNKSVLEKLEQWLRLYNANPVDGKIHSPMLLIDDEADNASVNTKKDEDTPTAINAGIRKLLKLFTRSNYVAFTATPYANIFINPDSTDEMLEDDLFPRDFIYALEAPTNYIGARTIFPSDGSHHYMIQNNDDCEYWLPEKHKKDFVPDTEMPLSLREAIASFFISNAIRDLRGQKTKHRSMLINISRFIDVQERIRKIVDSYVRELQREIKNYYALGDDALKHEGIAFIKDVYDRYFLPLSDTALDGEKRFLWNQIQYALHEAVAPIVVRTVNGGNAAKSLNYDECEEEGLRIIAIGGFSLSRGLTLEGLCTSYFHRNSKMYDTLMQMGRWFGYRAHYADVCQVWMSETSAEWYEYISEASDELRREVRKMRDLGLTPEYFGLGVRSDKDALLVTAINKMRYTEDIPMTISLNGEVVETPYLHMSKEVNAENYKAVSAWIEGLKRDGYDFSDTSAEGLCLPHPQICDIPKQYIVDLLSTFKSHYLNMDFRTADLTELIKNYTDGTVDFWDVLIANGSCEPRNFCGKEIKPIRRAFAIKTSSKALQMSGKGSRLGSANHAKGGLTIEQKNRIEAAARALRPSTDKPDKAFSQEEYFNSGEVRNPLLVIYPVQLSAKTKASDGTTYDDPEKEALIREYPDLLVGLSIGIPNINGRKKEIFRYRINLVKWKELLDVDDDYLEETGNED
ncbi:Z1 domain-containing protein [Enterocloster clostridioformis]|uniref:Z1 domain-containing protein n=1 Tax=Enterocloster clostridioformis TaxID=1531 RepID=A0A1I0IUW9_9FIRM|nr:Z1 domain-containing protein [Enterocloster clostridioformis]SEU01095.1 Z1 domain-containing protein [Enterocloster clostridioformis]SEW41595.1 Z1 domain-containing protein [Enterocloster clostridioformis]